MLRDLSEEELRAAAPLKWAVDRPGILEAWVAELDLALAEPVHEAVRRHLDAGVLGYPAPAQLTGVPAALAAFAAERWDWQVDPEAVTVVGSVMAGMHLVLRRLAEPGPVIVPTPVYPPFLATVRDVGHELVEVPLTGPANDRLDLSGIAAAVEAGARTILLCHPHNPVGRAWTREELEALREVVEPAGVRVVSDEIHAPLTHPGVRFVPYATVAGPEAPVTTLLAATKAFSMPGLPSAQLVSHTARDRSVLRALHPVLLHGSTTLGQVAAVAAYRQGGAWLDAVRERVAGNQARFHEVLGRALPQVPVTPANATYLAWLDVRALGLADPAGTALERGRVRVDGQSFGAGSQGRVRVNLGTSPERVEEIARRLVRAWGG